MGQCRNPKVEPKAMVVLETTTIERQNTKGTEDLGSSTLATGSPTRWARERNGRS